MARHKLWSTHDPRPTEVSAVLQRKKLIQTCPRWPKAVTAAKGADTYAIKYFVCICICLHFDVVFFFPGEIHSDLKWCKTIKHKKIYFYRHCICVSVCLCTRSCSRVQEACEPAVVKFLHPSQFPNLDFGQSGGCTLCCLLGSCSAGFHFPLWILFLFLALHFLLFVFIFLPEAMRTQMEKIKVNVTVHIFRDKQESPYFPMCTVLAWTLSCWIMCSLKSSSVVSTQAAIISPVMRY